MGSVRKGCAPAFKAHSRHANRLLREAMGQAKRTTKLLLDLGKRTQGGANTGKRAYLDETAQVLKEGRADLTSSSFWHTLRCSKRRSYFTRKRTWKCVSASSPPMNSLPGLRPPPVKPQNILTPGPAGTLLSGFPKCPLSIGAR